MAIERSIIDAAARLRRGREAHLVATVVRVQGAASRRPGARMLLTQFRWIAGSVSGGSLEGDIASKAWSRTRDGEPVVVTYDSRMPETTDNDDVRAALGLGCEGTVDIMFERAGIPGRIDPLEFAERCLRVQRRGAVVTVIRSEAPDIRPGMRVAVMDKTDVIGDRIDPALRAGMLADARSAIVTGQSSSRTYRSQLGNVDVFVEAILPPPRVFIFGTGYDAVPLVTLVKNLGWDAVVCATEERVAVRQRFTNADEILVGAHQELAARVDDADRAIALVMSHHHETDRANLGMLVGTHCQYIGVLGARARTQRMLAELGTAQTDARIHASIGQELAAETPQEVALAIVAELQVEITQPTSYRLRDRAPTNTNAVRRPQEFPVTPHVPTLSRMPRIADAIAAAGPVTGTHKRVTEPLEPLAL